MLFKRAIHRWTARLAARWPQLSDRLIASFEPVASTDVPWQPIQKPLRQATVALVTTAGIHHRDQAPFDMQDPLGDPSFRVIDPNTITGDYRITHDYYDHRDADRDLNIVFPIARLLEMLADGCVGAVADKHFSFMGHIDGRHVNTLTDRSAPRVAYLLKSMNVDVVLLTPA